MPEANRIFKRLSGRAGDGVLEQSCVDLYLGKLSYRTRHMRDPLDGFPGMRDPRFPRVIAKGIRVCGRRKARDAVLRSHDRGE